MSSGNARVFFRQEAIREQGTRPQFKGIRGSIRTVPGYHCQLVIGAQHTGDGKVVSVKVLWPEKKGWTEKKDPVGLGRSSTWGVRHVVVVRSLSPENATSSEDAVVGDGEVIGPGGVVDRVSQRTCPGRYLRIRYFRIGSKPSGLLGGLLC
ncbi:hypothetical protein L2E82_14400 [Cichorium intybus]|uniref:Uncharacterized protein n=1 Tax=Cichorium intybus TaxID=13427 RepID=A0ACB9EZ78_CICIN|nr:hypothetical protein L2E82_14400 [Cichorium intybus]